MKEFLKKHGGFILLMLIILGGGCLRFYGLDWGLPNRYHTDENAFINAVNAMRKAPRLNYLNPKWFYHPSLGMYVLCVMAKATSFFRELDLPTVHLLGRLYAAFCGTLSVWAVYLVGKKLYSGASGLLSALFLACTVIHIQNSHYFTPDVPLTLYLLLAMFFAADIYEGGRRRSYVLAGVFSGVAMATKYWAPTMLMVVVAHLIRFFSQKERGLSRLISVNLLCGILAAFITFFLCSPYVILDYREAFPRIIRWAAITAGRIPQVWALHCEKTTPYSFHLLKLFPWAMGLPLEVAGFLGLVWAFFRHRKADLLVLSWIVVNFLLIGSWYIKFTRYILPLVPFLCITGARFLVELYKGRSTRRGRILAGGATVAVALLSGVYACMFTAVYAQPHSRTAAAGWIRENLAPGSLVVVDGPSNVRIPVRKEDPAWSRFRFRYLDFIPLFIGNPPREEKERYLKEILSGADALVLNEAYRRYYEAAGDLYPVENRFWDDLFSGRLGFRLVETFKTYPKLGPFFINDDAAEMSFAFSDHPAVYVFIKTLSNGVME